MTHASLNGASLKKSIVNGGVLSLAQSSKPLTKKQHAKLNAGARAAYDSMMNGLADFDTATFKLKAKCLQIAAAVLEAAERVEDHFP